METISTHDAVSLPPADRAAIEHLLGRPLQPGQTVMIAAYTPGVADPQAREAARSRLLGRVESLQQSAVQQGTTSEEVDAALREAMAHVRPRDV